MQVRIAGEDGEIQVLGPGVMKGYYNRREEDALSFTVDGWFRTGDVGTLDAERHLSITGRLKELIIRRGEKVMPREVEEVLSQCPGCRGRVAEFKIPRRFTIARDLPRGATGKLLKRALREWKPA